MSMKTIKLVVSHRGHLLEKYGAEGLASIEPAIAALIAKDRQREIDTVAVWLDDAESLRPYGADPVGTAPLARRVQERDRRPVQVPITRLPRDPGGGRRRSLL
jgi:hypothetical protein